MRSILMLVMASLVGFGPEAVRGDDSPTDGGQENTRYGIPDLSPPHRQSDPVASLRDALRESMVAQIEKAQSAIVYRLSPLGHYVEMGNSEPPTSSKTRWVSLWGDDLLHRKEPRARNASAWTIDGQPAYPILEMRRLRQHELRLAADGLLEAKIERDPKLPRGNFTSFIKLCGGFEPGVAVRFEGKGRHLDALVCFKCDEMWLISGKTAVQIDTEAARAHLISLARTLLPGDPQLEELE